MENEKKLPTAAQELPDEGLDAIAGGTDSGSVYFVFKPGNRVRFAMTDGSSPCMDGVVKYSYMKEYNGRTIPHYAITVNYYTGSTIFRDVPQHRIRFPF